MFIVTTVSDSMPFFRGQLHKLKELFQITLVCSPGSQLNDMGELHDVSTQPLTMMREISIWEDVKSLWKLYQLFWKEKPTVVHGNTPKGALLSMITSFLARVPVRIYYVHGLRYQSVSGKKRQLLIFMEKFACYLATDIIAVSHGTRAQMQADKITRKPIQMIWNGSINGLDVDYFNPDIVEAAQVDEICGGDFVFGFVGRIVRDKGVEELIEAFLRILAHRVDIKLLMVGPFEENSDLKQETVCLLRNHPNIVYVGTQSDVRPYYKLMDTFVLPSYREGFGIVLIEAAAMGVITIVSDITGCNEVVLDGETGYLVKVKDVDSLHLRMQQLVEDSSSAAHMKDAARAHVLKRYRQDLVWQYSQEKYKEIIEKYV